MKHPKFIYGLAGIVILIVIVQFADSYQSELFTKLQSFFITEYFVEGKGMSFNTSAGLFICITANNIIVFAVGNAVVTFGTSLDIQYLYIA